MMTNEWLPALFGAFFQELLRWLPLLSRKPSLEERRRVSSGFYWIPAILLVGGGTVGTYYFTLGGQPGALQCIAIGAAFPALFKKVVDAFMGGADKPGHDRSHPAPDRTPKMGGDPAVASGSAPAEPSSSARAILRDFFR
jgi:hypothetical protein